MSEQERGSRALETAEDVAPEGVANPVTEADAGTPAETEFDKLKGENEQLKAERDQAVQTCFLYRRGMERPLEARCRRRW